MPDRRGRCGNVEPAKSIGRQSRLKPDMRDDQIGADHIHDRRGPGTKCSLRYRKNSTPCDGHCQKTVSTQIESKRMIVAITLPDHTVGNTANNFQSRNKTDCPRRTYEKARRKPGGKGAFRKARKSRTGSSSRTTFPE